MAFRRALTIGAVITAVVVVALVLFGGGGGYTVTARFQNTGGLIEDNPVQTGGQQIGSVKEIRVTDDGEADVTFKIDELHSPLPRQTRALIRQPSLSGVVNRYIDLTIPPDTGQGKVSDGGRISGDYTRSPAEFDQVLAALDPPTRRAAQEVIQGSAATLHGKGRQLNRGLRYLNPALSTSSRLFAEATRDVPLLERTLVNSAKLVTALSERRERLAALVGEARDTTRALGNQKLALAESIERLPPFLRRANTTFVNLRAALDDVDPLVSAAKPAAHNLRPFLAEARQLAAGAKPTLRDLRLAIRRSGRQNDLIEVTRGLPALADIATVKKRRTYAPGGRRFSVGSVEGTFPQVVKAAKGVTPVISTARPYTQDFLGWLDDFSTTGGYFDANGGIPRTFGGFAENLGTSGQPKNFQFHRCPGGADIPLRDGSNVLSKEEQQRLNCREEDRAVR